MSYPLYYGFRPSIYFKTRTLVEQRGGERGAKEILSMEVRGVAGVT